MLFGVQDLGRGTITYLADDVLFRCFWENGKLMFANSVPYRFSFLCPWLDVMGTETDWLSNGEYQPASDAQMPARIGSLLHQSWQVKKRLSPRVSAPEIDELYEFCLGNGALGGKLCGAGGGGFLLIVVPPDRRANFVQAIGGRKCVRFRIDSEGAALLSAAPPPTRPLA